jgi:hypothetical protein
MPSRFPTLTARLATKKITSLGLRAIVDTGATYSIIPFDVAEQLDVTRQDLQSARTVRIAGFGSTTSVAYRWRFDLVLGYGNAKTTITLPDSTICIIDGKLPGQYGLLIGQEDALRRLKLIHLNQNPDPRFMLETG